MKNKINIFIVFYAIYFFTTLFVLNQCIDIEEYTKSSNDVVSNWEHLNFSLKNTVPILNNTFRDSNSMYFYISHPPFSYYILYGFHKIFHQNAYLVLNVILTFISSFFIYLIILLLSLKAATKEFSIFGLIGAITYCVQPAIIKFQLFNYHPDIFVQTFIIIFSYIFLKLIMKERYRSIKYIVLFSLFIFILNYSSWFGVMYCILVCMFGVVNARKGYKMIPFVFIALAFCFLALLITYLQYSQIEGWKQTIFNFKNIYIKESPLGSNYFSVLKTTWMHMFKYIGTLIILTISLVIYTFFNKHNKFIFTKNGYKYLIISFLPVILFNIIFFNYAQNAYTTIYLVAPLTIISSVWLEKIFHHSKNLNNLYKIVIAIIISSLSLLIAFL